MYGRLRELWILQYERSGMTPPIYVTIHRVQAFGQISICGARMLRHRGKGYTPCFYSSHDTPNVGLRYYQFAWCKYEFFADPASSNVKPLNSSMPMKSCVWSEHPKTLLFTRYSRSYITFYVLNSIVYIVPWPSIFRYIAWTRWSVSWFSGT